MTHNAMIKFCQKCGVETERGGSRNKCKPCRRIANKAWKTANKERLRAESLVRLAAWIAANPDRKRAADAAWKAANAERVRAYDAAWRAANPERARTLSRARTSKWRAANPERSRAQSFAWKQANVDHVRAKLAEWRAANPEKIRIHWQNRRTRKKGGALSADITTRLFNLQRGKCACCGLSLGMTYHLDHVVPLALGGANEDSNVQLLRAKCNLQKGTKHPVNFMQEKGFLL